MAKESKFIRILKRPRVIVLLISLFIALLFINPWPFAHGAMINSVMQNSPAAQAGVQSPPSNSYPRSKEIITAVDYNNSVYHVNNLKDYEDAISNIPNGSTYILQTNKESYSITLSQFDEAAYYEAIDNATSNSSAGNSSISNSTNITNATANITKAEFTHNVSAKDSGIVAFEAAKTNIVKGLDLSGGTRVLIGLNNHVSADVYQSLVDSVRQRLNVFGLSDVTVRPSQDLSGNQYVVVEMAGVNEQQIEQLLGTQGKFEAKIGDTTIFEGGKKDVRYVCRSASCSGIDPYTGCQGSVGNYVCSFRFQISISPEAAQRQAAATSKLTVIPDSSGQSFLSKNLSLFLDNKLVEQLRIAASLKGSPQTDIVITGSGSGYTMQEAQKDALNQMNKLQTILETGSLPVKINILQVQNISPSLGSEFLANSFLVGLFAVLAVIIVLVLAYRRIVLSVPIIIVMLSELILILGFAAAVRWNMDLASIAGIIVAIGTGVDDQIVITDETIRRTKERNTNFRAGIKAAFFIILGAFFTTVAAMVPLFFAGAGMLRGFALTTIVGVSFGVLIARPAFAEILRILVEDSGKEKRKKAQEETE